MSQPARSWRPRFTNTAPSSDSERTLVNSSQRNTLTPPTASRTPARSHRIPTAAEGMGGCVSISARQFKQLLEQQNALQETNERIVRLLESQQEQQALLKRQDRKIPKELSGHIHAAYFLLGEQSEPLQWDFSFSFENERNRRVSAELLTNAQAIGESYSVQLVKRAIKTFFKTRQSRFKREARGMQDKTTTKCRRRQRLHNKAAARKRVLQLSTTIDQTTKDKIRCVLIPDFMSSDESELCTNSGSSSDENNCPFQSNQRKRLRYHSLTWRSTELESYIQSLDRKIERRRTGKGKQQVIPVKRDGPPRVSNRQPPEGAPDWAVSPFFEADDQD